MLWETAKQKCASQNPNARLVKISTSQENQFVKGRKIYMKTMFHHLCSILQFIIKILIII